MNIILLGPPGSGKSTQAKLLGTILNLTPIISGDIARAIGKVDSVTGEEVREEITEGHLIPSQLLAPKVEEAVKQALTLGGFILDGYPRDPKEAAPFLIFLKEANIAIDVVIVMELSLEEAKTRMLERAKIEKRTDDTVEAITERFAIYENQTVRVIELFKKEGIVKEVSGSGSIVEVNQRLRTVLS